MIKTIKNVILATLLAFCALGAQPVLADSAENAQASTIKDIFSVDADYENDMAQKWIKQLFGGFIFTDGTTGSSGGVRGDSNDVTILSHAIGFSNVLAMIFGIVIVSYLFIAGAMNTAHHGEVLGKNWSSVWLPARLAIGFGLIMPAGNLGGGVVSTIQALTIWMILVGSNAANVLWNNLTDQISSGVSVNSNIMIPVDVPKQVIHILACRISYLNQEGDNNSFILSQTAMRGSFFQPVPLKGDAGSYELPLITYKEGLDKINFGACGKITLNTPSWSMNSDDDDASDKVFTFLTQASKEGKEKANQKYVEYINGLIPLINQYYKSQKSGGLGGSEGIGTALLTPSDPGYAAAREKSNDMALKLFNAGVKISVQIPKDIKASIASKDFEKAFSDELKKGGWGTGGLWFMRVGAVQNMIAEITLPISETVSPAVPSTCIMADWFCTDNAEKKNARIQSDINVATSLFGNGASLYVSNGSMSKSANDIDPAGTIDLTIEAARQASSGVVKCDGVSCSVSSDSNLMSVGLARMILSGLSPVDDEVRISGGSSVTDTSGVASPFATAASIGNMSINIMQTMLVAAGAGSAISAGASATPPGKALMKAVGPIVESLATVAMAIGAYFGAIGITLAFVIPFMPAMLWMMMIVGYLLCVIEAMIASPFATIMMVTPEGEGIAGTRLEKAIGLLALVILRPSLMVMGLIAAITLSSVSFSIFNQFFWYTAETAITGSMFTVLVIIGMYTTGLFQICKYSISVMSKLPDQILDWMSMGGHRPFADDAAGGVEKGVDGGVKATQGMIGNISRDVKNRMRKPPSGGGGGGEPPP